jgi:hypothetical protein
VKNRISQIINVIVVMTKCFVFNSIIAIATFCNLLAVFPLFLASDLVDSPDSLPSPSKEPIFAYGKTSHSWWTSKYFALLLLLLGSALLATSFIFRKKSKKANLESDSDSAKVVDQRPPMLLAEYFAISAIGVLSGSVIVATKAYLAH